MKNKVSLRPFAPLEDLEAALQLYQQAFPIEERRPAEQWVTTLTSGQTLPWTILYNNNFAGFIILWRMEDFIYGEHFAINPSLRGQGIGSEALSLILKRIKKPLIIEVEPPESDTIAQRRIAFYQRHGLHFCPKAYLQPPYRDTDKPFPLCLMSSDEKFINEQFNNISKQIHRVVYGKTNTAY